MGLEFELRTEPELSTRDPLYQCTTTHAYRSPHTPIDHRTRLYAPSGEQKDNYIRNMIDTSLVPRPFRGGSGDETR